MHRPRFGSCALVLSIALIGGIAPTASAWAQDTAGAAADAPPPEPVPAPEAVPVAPGEAPEVKKGTVSVAPVVQSLQDRQVEVPFSSRIVSFGGLFLMIFFGWLMSTHKRLVPWRIIFVGLGLQLTFGYMFLRTDIGMAVFGKVRDVIVLLLGYSEQGSQLLFGKDVAYEHYFAFIVLPTIIFFSSLMTVLYHLRVMQVLVGAVAWVMQRTMKTSGAESLSAAGNIFVGQTEAPLLIRPYVEKMTISELMAVMVGGFATVAGGVMAAYVGMFGKVFPDLAGHLLSASVMSAPAALLIAKVMVPETEVPETATSKAKSAEIDTANVVDAAARGAGDGLKLALNVGAMLLAFVALVAMCNGLFGWMGGWFGHPDVTLQQMLGYALAPLAWVMGVPWDDATTVGSLLGVKTVLNEFFAYDMMATAIAKGEFIHARSVVITTYALCGFANFGSIAIQIGGIGGIAPSRRTDLARIGIKAMIGGTLAAFMTATVAGIMM